MFNTLLKNTLALESWKLSHINDSVLGVEWRDFVLPNPQDFVDVFANHSHYCTKKQKRHYCHLTGLSPNTNYNICITLCHGLQSSTVTPHFMVDRHVPEFSANGVVCTTMSCTLVKTFTQGICMLKSVSNDLLFFSACKFDCQSR